MPDIQIVHYRNPDASCQLRLFIDGHEVPPTALAVEDIDPGAGHDLENLNQRCAQSHAQATTPAGAAVWQGLRAALPYFEQFGFGDPDGWAELRGQVERE